MILYYYNFECLCVCVFYLASQSVLEYNTAVTGSIDGGVSSQWQSSLLLSSSCCLFSKWVLIIIEIQRAIIIIVYIIIIIINIIIIIIIIIIDSAILGWNNYNNRNFSHFNSQYC